MTTCFFEQYDDEIVCSEERKSLATCTKTDAFEIVTEAGILPDSYEQIYTCSAHFSYFLRLNQNRKRRKLCGIPPSLSSHPCCSNIPERGRKSKKIVGGRPLTVDGVLKLRQQWGVIVPVNTNICVNCRRKLFDHLSEKAEDTSHENMLSSEENVQTIDKPYLLRQAQSYTCEDNFQDFDIGSSQNSMDMVFSSQNTVSSVESYDRRQSLDILNNFLVCRNVAPLSLPLQSWNGSSPRTKRRYQGLLKDCFLTIFETLFPNDIDYDVIIKDLFKNEGFDDKNENRDTDIISALVESYQNSPTWQVRRQVLSVLAIKLNFKQLLNYIPALTEYRYYVAQKHSILYGCAIPPHEKNKTRNKMDPEKLSNFLDFITSSHIIKDLPFGERRLKLSSGEVMDAPNIIRCMGPAAIIQQYQAYCEENEISSLGTSTMFKILSECSATVRKSLEGLDYFVAEGSRGFQDLQDIVMTEGLLQSSNRNDLNKLLLETKRYLKTDYKVHVLAECEVADHCRQFALSSSNEEAFKGTCDHDHNKVCESCEQLKELLSGICKEAQIAELNDPILKDDTIYKVKQAYESIIMWKAHTLRARNQECAKSHYFNTMEDNEVLLVFDWAMKYLPRKYREDQLDWFGKRGISWHVSVCFRKTQQELQSLTYLHIFNSQVSQDSKTTSAVICDVLNNLTIKYPNINSFHLWSDNAACYKCADTFINIHENRSSKGKITSYDFCEAQDGKGACDRAAATVKSGIKRFINQGNDVVNAKQMKTAIERTKKNVRCVVKVVEIQTGENPSTKPQASIPGITSYNNFIFEETGIRVWKSYGIGTGLLIPWNSVLKTNQYLPGQFIYEVESQPCEIMFGCVKRFKEEDEENEESIFTCPTEGCMKSFSKYKQLDLHLHLNNCNLVAEKQCRTDITKQLYVEKLKLSESLPAVAVPQSVRVSDGTDLSKGWALRKPKKACRFSEKQKKFLDSKFRHGVLTGNKSDPVDVSNEMRHIKNQDGTRMFEMKEFLSPQQINSYFSRTCKKAKDISNDDQVSAQFEQNLTAMNTAIVTQLSSD